MGRIFIVDTRDDDSRDILLHTILHVVPTIIHSFLQHTPRSIRSPGARLDSPQNNVCVCSPNDKAIIIYSLSYPFRHTHGWMDRQKFNGMMSYTLS